MQEGRAVISAHVSRAFVKRIAEEYGRSAGVYRDRVEDEFLGTGGRRSLPAVVVK